MFWRRALELVALLAVLGVAKHAIGHVVNAAYVLALGKSLSWCTMLDVFLDYRDSIVAIGNAITVMIVVGIKYHLDWSLAGMMIACLTARELYTLTFHYAPPLLVSSYWAMATGGLVYLVDRYVSGDPVML